MEIICTRPDCTNPRNFFSDFDDEAKIRSVQQRYCTSCGMPLLLADRYIPSKLLGKGGFGAAFLARDRYKPKMPVCVVKQFQPSDNLDAHEVAIAQKLFQREAEVLAELGEKHPQIPDLYAFFTPIVPNRDHEAYPAGNHTGEEQYFYLAQEFIDGQDLDTELESKGKFSEAEVREILTEILKVLQFVHENNSIHRDIKPSNIMRSKQGVLYLLDFGAVKQVAVGSGIQKKSTGIYSMGFAPPEQMSGSQVYPSTDIYALAVTCITLLTGKAAEELYDSFHHNWNWQSYSPQTSEHLVTILNKMLQATPAERFQSATEALTALEINQSPKASPPSFTASNPAIPAPQPVVSQNSSTHPKPLAPRKPRFSLVEVLSSSAFTGFEGALLYIGLTSLLTVSGLSLGLFGMIMGGLIFAQTRRLIEKIDFVIFAGITFAIIALVPVLQGNLGIQSVLIIATMSAAAAIAITSFFRLVYQLMSRLL